MIMQQIIHDQFKTWGFLSNYKIVETSTITVYTFIVDLTCTARHVSIVHLNRITTESHVGYFSTSEFWSLSDMIP